MDSPCESLKRKPAPVDLEFCEGVKGKFEESEEFFTPKEHSEVSPRTECSAGDGGKKVESSSSTEFLSDISKTQEIEEVLETVSGRCEDEKKVNEEESLESEKKVNDLGSLEGEEMKNKEENKELDELNKEQCEGVEGVFESEVKNVAEKNKEVMEANNLNSSPSQQKLVEGSESAEVVQSSLAADKTIKPSQPTPDSN